MQAAYNGSLQTVEWLLSDAPIRCYNEFAEANSNDKRIKCLSEAGGGFEACVRQFLGARSHLIIHCCVMGDPTPESAALLHYLVKTFPEYIDVKSQDLMTPLQVAFRSHRIEAAKILIAAGADQTARDKMSNNLVHHLLKTQVTSEEKLKDISAMLDLIDKTLLPSLFLQRSAEPPGSLTPFAQFVHQSHQSHHYHQQTTNSKKPTIKTLLNYSHGLELPSLNGSGHTPLHLSILHHDEILTKIILEVDPTLLLREDATGRTPYEIAEDEFISSLVSDPPILNLAQREYPSGSKRRFQTLSICDRDPETFLADLDRDLRSSREKIWDLLQETKTKLLREGDSKRRLVTLNEANEVARRLAGKTRSYDPKFRGRFQILSEEEEQEEEREAMEGMDEVGFWMPVL